jgi:hypothetical protein
MALNTVIYDIQQDANNKDETIPSLYIRLVLLQKCVFCYFMQYFVYSTAG